GHAFNRLGAVRGELDLEAALVQADCVQAAHVGVVVDDEDLWASHRNRLVADFMRARIRRMRASWDEYFMGIAHQAATRSTCPRKHVGAVIVRDRTVLSTGYNGSIRGPPHCADAGCVMEAGHCITTVP